MVQPDDIASPSPRPQGVTVNDKEQQLVKAVKTRDIEGAKLLLEQSINPNLKDEQWRPLLNVAARDRDVDMVKLLLKHGADAKQTDDSGWNAIEERLAEMHSDDREGTRRELLNRNVEIIVAIKEHQLVKAVKAHDVEAAKLLLEQSINPNLKDELGRPLLNIAAEDRDVGMVEILLKHGADVAQTVTPPPNRQDSPKSWSR